jgi:hypothetical protein
LKYGRVGADPERERRYGRDGERRRFCKCSACVLQVASKIFDVFGAAHVPAFLLNLRNAAEASKRGSLCRLPCQPETDVLFDFLIEVQLELAAQFSLDGATPKERT